ncbi:MAG TPA: hypothetical protein VHJ59_06495 [Nitrososphaera sp.]|jgi:hypothetical protein|nr:hypothetical protein [Nitrososphaera sp.]
MTKLEEKISRLPELPVEAFEVAGKLGYSEKVPVITIRQHKYPVPMKPPNPTKLDPNKSEHEFRTYYVQATYPMVICQEPPKAQFDTATMFDAHEEESGRSDVPESDLATIAKKERFYKLTTLNGVKLPMPFWCSVHYGPWLAIVTEDESCTRGVPSRWDFNIIGGPEVSLSWYGRWEDIPSYPNLSVFMSDLVLKKVERSCCPGFRWCFSTMSCLAHQIRCPDQQVPV